ncbi:ABC transporter permease [Streptococcus sp. SGI.013]|uniref:ABC transporter permease n=1 Tax=unclassified Streptococcus TaxID=2608887 RepID=UPI003D02D703
MIKNIQDYFSHNMETYLESVFQHLELSFLALFFAVLLGLPLGYFSYRHKTVHWFSTHFSQALRVVPSLAVLFILVPFIGVGKLPALIALVVLALPPILFSTILGFSEVPEAILETGLALGMTKWQLLYQLSFPLARHHILNGIKLALIELIASATLATYIGAGGLGNLIFTGLGLYRIDLLMIGGGSVALLSFISMLGFDLYIRSSEYEK